jgi:hypothetical protein
MDAEGIDASPVLFSGSLRATATAVEKVMEPHIEDKAPAARRKSKRRGRKRNPL